MAYNDIFSEGQKVKHVSHGLGTFIMNDPDEDGMALVKFEREVNGFKFDEEIVVEIKFLKAE